MHVRDTPLGPPAFFRRGYRRVSRAEAGQLPPGRAHSLFVVGPDAFTVRLKPVDAPSTADNPWTALVGQSSAVPASVGRTNKGPTGNLESLAPAAGGVPLAEASLDGVKRALATGGRQCFRLRIHGQSSGLCSCRLDRHHGTLCGRLAILRARPHGLPTLVTLRLARRHRSGETEVADRRVHSRRFSHRAGADRRLDPGAKVARFGTTEAVGRRERLGKVAIGHLDPLEERRCHRRSVSARCKLEESSIRRRGSTPH